MKKAYVTLNAIELYYVAKATSKDTLKIRRHNEHVWIERC